MYDIPGIIYLGWIVLLALYPGLGCVVDSIFFLCQDCLSSASLTDFYFFFFVNVILHSLCPTSRNKGCVCAILMKRNDSYIN